MGVANDRTNMTQTLPSPNALIWQKLAKLTPSLPRHTHIQPRHYNDELWYVLEDKANGKFHRFNALAYQLLGFMNGRNNLEQIVASAAQSSLKQTLDDIPTREDLIELLQYLYVADLLVCDFPPQTASIFERKQKTKQQFWHQLIKSPYAWKIPLLNPDRLLQWLRPIATLLASPVMGLIWLFTVLYALFLAASHWPEISATQLTDVLSPTNLLLLWLTYPLLKVLHELGHGLFTTVWGGNVHEFGVVMILGTPFPYVDATSATGFARKRQRLMVSAAGMAVELFIAALALIIWLPMEQGLLRSILFNVILIGSISTLFFNGNPLMRFDGYHILCDAIDQPNMAARASLQLRYFVKRFGYGLKDIYAPMNSTAEGVGLASYGIAAFCYRMFILISIVLIVAKNFPTVGIVFVVWMSIFQIALPFAKHLTYLLASKELIEHRKQAIFFSTALSAIVAGILVYLPLPHRTASEGIIWLPEHSRIRALTAGEIIQSTIQDGTNVSSNQPLLYLSNIDITADLLRKQATLKEYLARYQQAWSLDRSQIQLFEQDIETIHLEIEFLQNQVNHLIIRSPIDGVFKHLQQHELVGSYVKEGDTIGLIINEDTTRVRVALTQEEIALVRENTLRIEVQVAGLPGKLIPATISQQVPGGTYTLPSPALGTAGGGRIVVDGSSTDITRAAERIFLVDIEIPLTSEQNYFGQRVFVNFIHTSQPLAKRFSGALQNLMLTIAQQDEALLR